MSWSRPRVWGRGKGQNASMGTLKCVTCHEGLRTSGGNKDFEMVTGALGTCQWRAVDLYLPEVREMALSVVWEPV